MLNNADLILNPDGSIYHLNLHPGDVADTIIFVGDPDRVSKVSNHFDKIELKKQKREFVTHTGYIGQKRLSVISTGIGVGDIVINELDALVNIDFKTRTVKDTLTQLNIVRLGTCGGLSEHVALDDFIVSQYAFAFDGLLNFYQSNYCKAEQTLITDIKKHFDGLPVLESVYAVESLLPIRANNMHAGITLTCPGFYGPQYRHVRAPLHPYDFLQAAQSFQFQGLSVLNYEMETAAILALGQLMGHRCASVSAVVANRVTDEFTSNMAQSMSAMIEQVLGILLDR